MKYCNKAQLICLTALTKTQLGIVYENVKKDYPIIEIYCSDKESEIFDWAIENNLPCKFFCRKELIVFITPNPDIKLLLPENFADKTETDVFFLLEAGISKDGYLLGAIYNLTRILGKKSITEYDFPDYALEMFFYFRKEICYVFTNHTSYMKGNAWSVDYNLIKLLRVKSNRIYSRFYEFLIAPPIPETSENIKISLKESSEKLYRSCYVVFLFADNVLFFGRKISGAFIILYTMISFKLKRKFKK